MKLYVEDNAVVVPSEAVQAGQSGHYVYVVKEDLTAENRSVTVSRTYGNESVITQGVKPGERVVTDAICGLSREVRCRSRTRWCLHPQCRLLSRSQKKTLQKRNDA